MDGARPAGPRELVLVGGGHSHVSVLKGFGLRPLPGVRVTLVSRELHTPYSGMLPGLVAGHYRFEDAHIDLDRLTRFAGIRLVPHPVEALDPAARTLRCPGQSPIRYDVLSLNIGSTPRLDGVPGAAGRVIPVKPIGQFTACWEELVKRVRSAAGRLSIGVVGGGAGGVELTLAADYALKNLLLGQGDPQRSPEFHLFDAAARILSTHNPGVGRRMSRILAERGIQVHSACRVVRVDPRGLEMEQGRFHPLDEILWVTQASAQAWPREAGLQVDSGGFVQVADTLESLSHPGVFAAGDVAGVVSHPREKAGVFAVRQGAPLEANLRRSLLGQPLRPFRPQRRFLSLIGTGDAYAVASRGSWSTEGRWVWRWKDWIDRRFMARFNGVPDRPRVGV